VKIVVVEDEPLIAERISRLSKEVLGKRLRSISVLSSLEEAKNYLETHCIDLLLLDLNLSGRDGFELLEHAVSHSFHTIVISANTDQALRAFEYGIIDFIGKPLSISRLEKAFERVDNARDDTRYLSVRKHDGLLLLLIEEISYIQGTSGYSEIHMQDGSSALHDKSLSALESILPGYFCRIHRSYIANLNQVVCLRNQGDHKYSLVLKCDEILPVSRNKYRDIKNNRL